MSQKTLYSVSILQKLLNSSSDCRYAASFCGCNRREKTCKYEKSAKDVSLQARWWNKMAS